MRATYSKDGIDARVLPIEIPRPGTIVTDVFVDPRDSEEHGRKQAERAAKRGLTVGPPVVADEWPQAPEPRFREGEEIVLLARAGGRRYPVWVWPAATAKMVLGCLCSGADAGAWPAKTFDENIAHALRISLSTISTRRTCGSRRTLDSAPAASTDAPDCRAARAGRARRGDTRRRFDKRCTARADRALREDVA